MKKFRLLSCISILALSMFTAACIGSSSNSGAEPEFKSFTAQDINGNTVNESILSGADLTVMNVWGTFCSPCIQEMPDLGEIARAYKGSKVQIIGVVIDAADQKGNILSTELESAKKIIKETNADYLHLIPSEDLLKTKLGSINAIPETLFIDKTGKIIHSEIGSKDKSAWEETIKTVLAKVK